MPHDGHHHHRLQPSPPHPRGHNGPAGADHLASHPHDGPPDGADAKAGADERQLVADAFIDGFRAAADKTSFLRMARIPFELDGGPGRPGLKLVDVEIADGWQVGTASPGFASDELVYHPFPGNMVRGRTGMRFVYVSLVERRDLPLERVLGLIDD